MKKCAYIRTPGGKNACPFGLPIVEGCIHAGNSVLNMCPLMMIEDKEKQNKIKLANRRVYIYYKTDEKCIYADNIIKSHNAVNCDFGDTAAGMGSATFSGSPLYAQTFAGGGLNTLYAYPMGFYADNQQSRNLFQGLFSLVGNQNHEIIKNAVLNNPNMKQIVEKLEDGLKLSTEEMLKLQSAIEECRRQFESNRTDSAKMYELSTKWR